MSPTNQARTTHIAEGSSEDVGEVPSGRHHPASIARQAEGLAFASRSAIRERVNVGTGACISTRAVAARLRDLAHRSQRQSLSSPLRQRLGSGTKDLENLETSDGRGPFPAPGRACSLAADVIAVG